MIQVSPEGNFSSREDTLLKNKPDFMNPSAFEATAVPLTTTFSEHGLTDPTTSDVIILGEDRLSGAVAHPAYDPDFIGPRDATNEARPLLENQARNLAQVAVMNFPAYNHQFLRVVEATRNSLDHGFIRLNTDYPKMLPDEQVEKFVTAEVMKAYKSHDEVAADLAKEKEIFRLTHGGPEQQLQIDLNEARKSLRAQGVAILKVREMLLRRGASEEFMKDFNYTTKLMTAPDREAYEHEKELAPEAEIAPLIDTVEVRLFDRFKAVIAPSFGLRALRSIGIRSPKSGEVTIIKQDTKTTR